MTQELSRSDIVQGAPLLPPDKLAEALAALPGWRLDQDGKAISRDWKLKNFVRAAELANVIAWLAEAANHHPDLRFGWGYVQVTFSTHSAGGVTLNDLIMATRINAFSG